MSNKYILFMLFLFCSCTQVDVNEALPVDSDTRSAFIFPRPFTRTTPLVESGCPPYEDIPINMVTFKQQYLDGYYLPDYSLNCQLTFLKKLVEMSFFEAFYEIIRVHKIALYQTFADAHYRYGETLGGALLKETIDLQEQELVRYLVQQGFSLAQIDLHPQELTPDYLVFLIEQGYPIEIYFNELFAGALLIKNKPLAVFLAEYYREGAVLSLNGEGFKEREQLRMVADFIPEKAWPELFENYKLFGRMLSILGKNELRIWESRGATILSSPDVYKVLLVSSLSSDDVSMVEYLLSNKYVPLQKNLSGFYRLEMLRKATEHIKPDILLRLFSSSIPFRDLPESWIQDLLKQSHLSAEVRDILIHYFSYETDQKS